MAGPSTNSTFKHNGFANVNGVDNEFQQITIETFTVDPPAPTLAATFPRVWINTTSGTMKFCVDGSTVKSVTAV